MEARVNKIIPFSSVDGPGNRTAIFLQGCNINCMYCHNPETRDKYGDPKITTVTEMSADEVLEQVKKQIPFVRGITVSGGECMLQPDFLTELFTKIKVLGLSTMIDTNGTIDFADKQDLLAVTDGVLLDIKAFDSDTHRKITGAGNETVIANARFLASIDSTIIFSARFIYLLTNIPISSNHRKVHRRINLILCRNNISSNDSVCFLIRKGI